jgi:DNA mismatch repair protein MutS
MSGTTELTPMMAQYQTMRRSLPDDIILFYRLGDFYEMFFEDAKVASSILNVSLTKRHLVPMCGVPWHAAEAYIAKLLKAGKRVAIAEQTSMPVAGKLVQREISRILTAGSIDDLNLLETDRPNYLAAVYSLGKKIGLACIDHSTGEFSIAEFPDKAQLEDELAKLLPSELLIAEDQTTNFSQLSHAIPYDGYTFLQGQALTMLLDQFSVQSLDGFGCSEMLAAIGAAGAVIHYLKHQLRRKCDHLQIIKVRKSKHFVQIDSASQRNLDLVESRVGRDHTLLGVLDRTHTPMGARLLREWILHPLRDISLLQHRQNFISTQIAQPFLLSKFREALKGIRDIERTTSRLSQGAGNARDLLSLAISLESIPALRQDLISLHNENSENVLRYKIISQLYDFSELTKIFSAALSDEPPLQLKEGGIIRDGWSPELDELRAISRDGKGWIAKLQESERQRSGIDSLKIKFNNVFGYFIEISNNKISKVPDNYTRKQTLANAERYITPALKEMEHKVLGSEERSRQLEYELFIQLRGNVNTHLVQLQETAAAIAMLDVLCSLSETAQRFRHVCPKLDQSRQLQIENGRHPVLEQTIVADTFVPNDTEIEPENALIHIITGPNMAGKSTYIRQVALITIMAQIGAFVPADLASIGIVDKIFCRVGASDDLSRGQSTFMVEMNETALILNNATEKSLVILDEVGRGTATFDGLSIAWAVAEHLHDEIKCRTLFATHYHELTDLANTRIAVANFNIAVREWNEEIIFLRKILSGTADKSYGIQVARLAGLPQPVINRAKAILSHLELNSSKPDAKKNGPKAKNTFIISSENGMPIANSPQMTLFD